MRWFDLSVSFFRHRTREFTSSLHFSTTFDFSSEIGILPKKNIPFLPIIELMACCLNASFLFGPASKTTFSFPENGERMKRKET